MREVITLQNGAAEKEKEINDVIAGTRKELGFFWALWGKVEKLMNRMFNTDSELNTLSKEVQTNNKTNKTDVYQPAYDYLGKEALDGVDMPQKDFFKAFLEYMQHQQGAAGTNAIVQNLVMGTRIPSNILSNMRNNVSTDFPGGKNKVNGPSFVKYWYKRFADQYKKRAHKATPYEDAIEKAARVSGQPKEIIKTIIGIESNGDVYANKWKKSSYKGLMQVDIRQAKQYGVTNIYDPEQNIMMAMKLRQQNSNQLNKLDNYVPTLIAKVNPNSSIGNAA